MKGSKILRKWRGIDFLFQLIDISDGCMRKGEKGKKEREKERDDGIQSIYYYDYCTSARPGTTDTKKSDASAETEETGYLYGGCILVSFIFFFLVAFKILFQFSLMRASKISLDVGIVVRIVTSTAYYAGFYINLLEISIS